MQTDKEGSEQNGTPSKGEEQGSGVFIQHYRVVTTLGRGSIGVTYKAEDTRSGETVILKTLKSISLHDDQGNEQVDFTHDTWPVASLVHPHLVPIRDVGFHDSSIPYIVFEYVEGQGLDVLISQKGAMDVSEALPLLRQVASALDYAHSFAITHGNLKPGNILVTRDHNAMIIDLGIAELSSESVTPVGTVFGANSYLSPEQLHALPLDKYSDIFSFGLMVFELLTGMHPFPGTSFNAIVSSVMNKPPISFMEMGSSLPEELEEVLLKAMEKEKENRYDSCEEFIDAIAAVFENDPLEALTEKLSSVSIQDVGSTLFGSDLETIVSEVKDEQAQAALEEIAEEVRASSQDTRPTPEPAEANPPAQLFEQSSRPRTASGTLTNIARMVAQDSLMQASSRSSSDSLDEDPMLDATRHQIKNGASYATAPTQSQEGSGTEESVDNTLFGAGGLVSEIQDAIKNIKEDDIDGTLYGSNSTTRIEDVPEEVEDPRKSQESSLFGIPEDPVEERKPADPPATTSSVPALRPEREVQEGSSLIIKLLMLAIIAVAAIIGIVISQNPRSNAGLTPDQSQEFATTHDVPLDDQFSKLASDIPDSIDSNTLSADDISGLNDQQIARLLRDEGLTPRIRRLLVAEAGPRELEGMIPYLTELLEDSNLTEEEKLTVIETLNTDFYLQYEEVIDALIGALNSDASLVRGFSAKVLSQVNLPFVREAVEKRVEIERNPTIKPVIEKALSVLVSSPSYAPGSS